MALLLTPVFGVTGCGSDENTQLKTEITQLETEITQLETEITQFEARVDALEEQAGSRVTNSKLDPNSTISSSENDELRSLENEFDDQTDDAVQFQSRSKNAAPGIDASGAPSKADCDRVSDLSRLLYKHEFHEYPELPDESQLHYRPDDLDLLDRVYDNDLLGNLDNLDRLYDYTDLLDRLYYDIGYDLDFRALRTDLRDLYNRNCEPISH